MFLRQTSGTDKKKRPFAERLRESSFWKTLEAIKDARDIGASLVSVVLLALTGITFAKTVLAGADRSILLSCAAAVFGAAAAASVIYAWSRYRKNEENKKTWRLVGDISQLPFLVYKSYKQTVIFGRQGEVEAWYAEIEIEHRGDQPLESLSNYAWYDGEQSGIRALPANVKGTDEYITIEDELLGHDGSYNFITKLHPALQPHQSHTYRYRIKLHKAKPMRHPYIAILQRAEHGYEKSVFSVQFHEDMLPRGGKVRQVFWPYGVGKDSGGWKELAILEADENNNEVSVSFGRDNAAGLSGDPSRQCYGLVWEWGEPKSRPFWLAEEARSFLAGAKTFNRLG